VEVLAVLELAVLLAEQPGQHLPGLHAGTHDASGFVPVTAAFAAATAVPVLLVALDHLQADLIEYADQQLIDVVTDADRHFDELCAICTGQALSIWKTVPKFGA